jgi:hypothetical protein
MNKTRKIRNKKLFLKWLKKSHRNKYNIVHGGAKGDKGDVPDQKIVSAKSESGTFTKENAVLLAGAVTLSEVAFRLASNPVVVSAVVGLGIGSAAFTGVLTGGATLVLILVAAYAFVKIRALYSNYYTMIYVMNDYILLLKKIDTMVRLAVKISQEYKFVIDTKDVNKSLERILNRFDKLLTEKDISEIKENVSKSNDSNNIVSELSEEAAADQATDKDKPDNDSSSENDKMLVVSDGVKKRQENILKRFGKSIKAGAKRIKDNVNEFRKVINLNSKEFTEELNEEVMRLGLYFSILVGELNIILNVCQMDIIGKGNKAQLISKNDNVKSDDNFIEILISSLIYRTLQLHNIFILCGIISSKSDTAKKMCTRENMDEYVKETEVERKKIRMVLLTKQYDKILFPLYEETVKGSDNKLKRLIEIMLRANGEINGIDKAKEFIKNIHDFNNIKIKTKGKSMSASQTSTDKSNAVITQGVSNPEKTPIQAAEVDLSPQP